MHFTTLLPLVAALPSTLAFPGFHSHHANKRAYAANDVTLYAYGTNISGLPLLYGANDGFVYINGSNNTAAGYVSVTWDIPSMSTASTTTTVAMLANGTSAGNMSIKPGGGLFDNVKVVNNGTSFVNETVYGLTVYGKQLVYYDESSLQAEFWARPSVVDGHTIWTLLWNSDNENESDTTPVAIKTIAPAIKTSKDKF